LPPTPEKYVREKKRQIDRRLSGIVNKQKQGWGDGREEAG